MEILWKSFNNILWTTDDSAIGRINICGDPDSSIGRKKPQKRVLVLNVRISLQLSATYLGVSGLGLENKMFDGGCAAD